MHKPILLTVCLLTLACTAVSAKGNPDLDIDIMKTEYALPGVASSFRAGADWLPYPAYSDREGWNAVFGPDAEFLIKRAEKFLSYEWKHIPATAYLAFERTGDRKAMENLESANRGAFIILILGELAEGKGRFIDQIANGLYQSSERHNWVLSAHNANLPSGRSLATDKFIDLAAGRYSAIVSLACHYFGEQIDAIDPSICRLARKAVKENALDPFLNELKGVHLNWWVGDPEGKEISSLNNWTPWCCTDVVLSALLLETDQERLDSIVRLSTIVMDNFLNYIKKDGACEEGPAYWGAAGGKTCDYVEIMKAASGGKFDVTDNVRLRRFGEYMSRQYIGNGWTTNFADGAAKGSVYTMGIWGFARTFGSKELRDFACYTLADNATESFKYPTATVNDGYRAVQTYFYKSEMKPVVDSLNSVVKEKGFDRVLQDLRKDVPLSSWYDETEFCFLRNSSRWFLGAKGGFNDESHNHNDIGTCILFIRDIPVLIDAGVGTYTRATFLKSERYKIWSMRGEWHNIPAPNGVPEEYGIEYRSKDAACNIARGEFSLELCDAYPDSAGIKSYVRKYSLAPNGNSLVIEDRYSLDRRTASDVQHFLVKGKVEPVGKGVLRICCDNGLKVRMTYPSNWKCEVEEKVLDDSTFIKVWEGSLYRISLVSPSDAPLKGKVKITLTEEK